MRKTTPTLLALSLAVLTAASALATAPGADVNSNGFPSGPHYNLNIHGKKDGFACPGVTYDELGQPVYGNSVFLPEFGGATLLMESGKGKVAAETTDLDVTDACAEAFDGTPAVLRLPRNDLGYRVYARALASPTGAPWLSVVPDLFAVQDEYGNDLLYLGLVTSSGFQTPYQEFTRAPGKSKAVDVSELFHWTGEVCYFDPGASYDAERLYCCADLDADGLYDSCTAPAEGVCADGSAPVTTYCNLYSEEWVFNIGDFVTYLWDVDNSGLKLLQVRFYPIR